MTNNNAGSATSIDLAALEQLARAVENAPTAAKQEPAYDKMHRYLTGSRVLALIALARATPQHPEAPAVQSATNIAWGHELQKRLMVADDQGDDDLHNLLGEVACCLASLTGRPDTALTPQHSVIEQASVRRWEDRAAEKYPAIPMNKLAPWAKLVEAKAEIRDLRAALAIPASTAATQPEQASERMLFEAWSVENGALFAPIGESYVGHGETRGYRQPFAQSEWDGWQARAALAIPASKSPSESTGIKDKTGKYICVGDTVESEDGYSLVIRKNKQGNFFGKLVCEPGDSCENIPYSLKVNLTIVSTAASEQHVIEVQPGHAFIAPPGTVVKHVPAASEQQAGARVQTHCASCNRVTPSYTSSHSGHECCMYCKFSKVANVRDSAALTHRATTAAPGYKWVPIEPTDAMAAAAIGASLAEPKVINGLPQYKAMLAAAPDIATTAADQQGDPMDWPLPCDVKVGGVNIRKGCKLRTLVTRMESLHRMAVKAIPEPTPEARAAIDAMFSGVQVDQQGDTASASVIGGQRWSKEAEMTESWLAAQSQQGAAQAQAGDSVDCPECGFGLAHNPGCVRAPATINRSKA